MPYIPSFVFVYFDISKFKKVMKKKILLFASLIIFSCQPSNLVSTDPNVAAIKDSIEKVFKAWSDQFESLNIIGIMEYMADADDLIWASDGTIIKGHDKISDWMNQTISPIEKWNYTNYGEADIYVLGLDAAVHSVDFEESFTFSTGDTIVIKGVWTNVFTKINGKWKVIHSASSYLDDEQQNELPKD